MTPTQCRMARAALEWSTTDLARAADVGVNSVNRFETGRDCEDLDGRKATLSTRSSWRAIYR